MSTYPPSCLPDCEHCETLAEHHRDRLLDASAEERAYEADMAADRYEQTMDDRW